MQLRFPLAAFSTTFLLSLGWGLGCGASTELPFECQDTGEPEQGFATCNNGLKHRPEVATCQLEIPRPGIDCGGGFDPSDCTTDSDCTEAPNGYCVAGQVCGCMYACETDSDCGDGYLCECRGDVSACVPTTGCKTDADCPGSICAVHRQECGGTGYSCVTSNDECTRDSDCSSGKQCLYNGSRRRCAVEPCVEGRPFYVDGHIRTATLEHGAAWSDDGVCRSLEGLELTPSARNVAQQHYLEMAAMEHASVAAFARFTLQLLSLGAPASLLEAAQKAQADELRHAKLAFAIAARLGCARQPGALDVSRALDETTPAQVLQTTILEGCIGETLAAARLFEAATLTSDRALTTALRQVAEDETRHAALAWRSVAWLIERHPDLSGVARQTLSEAIDAHTHAATVGRDQPPGERALDEQTQPLGVLSAERGSAVALAALEHLVRPAAHALFRRRAARRDSGATQTTYA